MRAHADLIDISRASVPSWPKMTDGAEAFDVRLSCVSQYRAIFSIGVLQPEEF